LRAGFQGHGYTVTLARNGEAGSAELSGSLFDAVVLDWMLPGRDGIELLKSFRSRGNKTPVLLLTARDAVKDRVQGLDSGADDFLIKPFAFAELLARVRVLLRRVSEFEGGRRTLGDLTVDTEQRHVFRNSKEILLTPREFDLLCYLIRHQGQNVTRQMLAKDVWREPRRVTPLDNVIDVHMAHLRRKIDEGHAKKLLHTIRGVGFMIQPPERP
jgi:DNA-binding response OmpR family regulator